MADAVDAPVQVTAEQLGVQARYVCAFAFISPVSVHRSCRLSQVQVLGWFLLDNVCRLAVTNSRDS